MTTTIIIAVCSLLLIAYIFDISSKFTKIPSVILLLLLGWVVRQITDIFHIQMPDLNPLLQIAGTIGLILIVLEGSLELELNKSKLPIIIKALFSALVPMFVLAFLLAWGLQHFMQVPYKTGLINAIPFCVISSAIAIPSVRNLANHDKEFVVYESSLSDIFGVLIFNFLVINDSITAQSVGNFSLELLAVIAISFVLVLALSFLLSRITHHITYTPIILLIILIYAFSKMYHLPGLIFIMVFGLFLGNLEELKQYKWIEAFHPDKLEKEIAKFLEITFEATFLIRALFFILFGYLMEAKEILNPETLPWAVVIVYAIVLIRYIALKIARLPVVPLLFVAPRGLITILLFLGILPQHIISLVNKSLIIQTIVLSVLLMMFGLMFNKKPKAITT